MHRRKICRFCIEKVDFIDFKDVKILQSYIPERGKILPRRISGSCATHQRMLAEAIKRARNIALCPTPQLKRRRNTEMANTKSSCAKTSKIWERAETSSELKRATRATICCRANSRFKRLPATSSRSSRSARRS